MGLCRIEEDTLDSLLEQLNYDLSEDEVQRCLTDAGALLTALYERGDSASGEEADSDTPERMSSDDPYNALLDIYNEPRKETSTGPLAGVSVVIKDNIATKNLRMTCGLRDLGYVPSRDAIVVERLLAAGAAIIGKANMYGMAVGPDNFSEWGQVENPSYPNRIPGGSSSGSAAAVAGGLADAAIGSDTGGSVRFPAAFCGLVGMKPTMSTVPRHGLVPLVPSFDSIGIIAKDVDQTAQIFRSIAGPDVRDLSTIPTDARPREAPTDDGSITIGVPESSLIGSIDGVRTRIESVLERAVERDTVNVTTIRLDTDFESVYSIIRDTEFTWLLRQRGVTYGTGTWFDPGWLANFRDLIDEGIKADIAVRMLPGALCDEQTRGEAYALCRLEVTRLQNRLIDVFDSCDILVTPTVPAFPPERSSSGTESTSQRDLAINTRIFNLAGTPAVAVPVGEVDGLPVSAQVVAPRGKDGLALEGARMIEQMT